MRDISQPLNSDAGSDNENKEAPVLVPGLRNTVTRGFNSVRGDFMSSPIFKISFEEGQNVEYGAPGKTANNFQLPDHLAFDSTTIGFKSDTSTFISNKSEYDQMMSVAVANKISGLGFSNSVNSKLTFHGNIKFNRDYTYALNFSLQETYNIRWPVIPELEEAFVAAVKALPGDIKSKNNQDRYTVFFERFGTHFLRSGSYGGFMTMETQIDETLFEQKTEAEISAGVTQGFQGMVNSNTTSVETAFKSSSFLSENRKEISITTWANGGILTAKLSDYFETVFDSPILLLNENTADNLEFGSMKELFLKAGVSEDLTKVMETALERYILEDLSLDGIIGSPEPVPLATVREDKSAGFLTVNLDKTKNRQRASYRSKESENSVFENTRLSQASIDYHSSSDDGHRSYITNSQMLLPVTGDYKYKVIASDLEQEKSPRIKADFSSLSVGDYQALKAPETMSNREEVKGTKKIGPISKKADGFVITSLEAKTQDNGLSATCKVTGSSPGGKILTATSVHYHVGKHATKVPLQSMVTPVRKDERFTLEFKQTTKNTSGTFQYFWVELLPPYEFLGNARERQTNLTYKSDQDGLLMVFLEHPEDSKDRTRASCRVLWDEEEGMPNSFVLAQTSVQYNEDEKTLVPFNCITVPVAKNRFYKIVTELRRGTVNTNAYWIPIIAEPNLLSE